MSNSGLAVVISHLRNLHPKSNEDFSFIFNNLDFNNQEKLYVFPRDFFSAKEMGTGQLLVSENTYSIHHFAMSWISKKDRFLPDLKRKLMQMLGYKTLEKLIKIMRLKEIKNKIFR